MAEIARFFDAIAYTEADQAEMQAKFRSTGVIGDITNTLNITAPGGMFVGVTEGEAMVEGFWYRNTPPTIQLPIATNTSGSTRVDVVALRLDRVANTLSAIVKQGTPGAGTPTLTQIAGGIWELGLATVTVPTGTTSAVTAGMLADIRTYSRTVTSVRDVADNTVGYSAILAGSVSNLLLNYKLTIDWSIGGSLAAASYTNIVGAQNFTVSAGAVALIISVQLSAYYNAGPASGAEIATHILIDGTTRYLLAGHHTSSSAGLAGIGSTIIIPGLSAGVHSVLVQTYTTGTLNGYYLRGAAQPGFEGLGIQVMEIRK